MSIKTPEWVKRAVFYQIFPDRFARSPRTKHPRGLHFKPWGSPPAEQGFQGGDLYGVVDKLDYLADLGVTALYLNPVFASAANHRYHTYDYLHIDPLLGGNAALAELIEAAHQRDIRIVLDGVFNHASRGFWAFHHILENGSNSPYLDWFLIRDWPLRPYDNPDNLPINYDAWWGIAGLPKFNIKNPGVRDYLLEVAEFWVRFGIDGWRLDVPEEIDDAPFWQDFRRVVKAANPEAYIVGEIWHEAHEWLQGDRFDAVMNYIFSRAAYGFFAAETLRMDYKPGGYPLVPLNANAFAKTVEKMLSLYGWEVIQAQLNLLDSHDTARTLWIVNNDESALRLCVLFQMTMPGAPCIYYGGEIGMTGGPDPDCRRAFPWQDELQWNHALLVFYRRAIHLRHRYPVLSAGSFRTVTVAPATEPHPHIYAFRRDLDGQTAIVVFNVGHHPVKLDLMAGADLDGRPCVDVWGKGKYKTRQGKLTGVRVPAREASILIA
jgi:neopullulanase